MSEMIEIEIDGNMVEAAAGEMLIAVADRAGVSVPRFCYHKKLSVAANCRMCLVDVEGAPKPQTACSTPVSEGMKIHTQNQKAKDSQKAVMEFLLINHPLDCPICDQGGECELQDVAMDYGSDVSRFTEGKRIVADSDIGTLIQTDMTRCIHCTRCVRFGAEVAGMMEMGGTGRGEDLKIEPFLQQGIDSELSGNMIDVCPVGALTSKPFRYELRSWQMASTNSISRHDLVGSNLHIQTHKSKVKRVVARENESVNETWIADRERFSYAGLSHQNRLLGAQIKVKGKWQEVEWNVALDFAVKGLATHIFNAHQADKLGALAASTATLEEFYLLQKILRASGCENIDYRHNINNLDAPIVLDSNIKLADLQQVNYALIVGGNLRLEQPLINHRLRKAWISGAKIDVINVMEFDFNYQINAENIIPPSQIASFLGGVLKAILQSKNEQIKDYLKTVKIDENAAAVANQLLNSENSALILGEHIINNPLAASIAALLAEISEQTGSSTLNLSATANSAGAVLAGFTPSKGLNAEQMLASNLKAYILLDIYPDCDFYDANHSKNALSSDDTFVISLNSFQDESVMQYADVLLPIASFYESAGSHVNIDGSVQSFAAAVNPPQDAKPAWKVLKVLADLLELPGFHYANCGQVTAEILHQQGHKLPPAEVEINLSGGSEIAIIAQKSPYAVDALCRHSECLQNTKIGKLNLAWMNQATAAKLELADGDEYSQVPVKISEKVADNCVFIYANFAKNGG